MAFIGTDHSDSFLAYYAHCRSSKTAYSKQEKNSIEIELLINSNSWEILLTIAIAIVPKMSIAIVISILLISSGAYQN